MCKRAAQTWPSRKWVFCIVLLSCSFVGAPALAQSRPNSEDTRQTFFSGGVRLWHAQWDSWNVNPRATGVAVGDDRYEVVESRRGSTELAPIPFVSLRYGALFVSASAMSPTDYSLHETATPGGFDVNSRRQEADLNLGYVFASGVSLTLGHKQIRQRFGPDEYKWRGPVIGLAGNARLAASGWGIYGSFGLGRLEGNFPVADVTGQTQFDARYQLADLGFTYSLSAPAPWVRAMVLTTGYRTQRMATNGYALAVIPSPASGQAPRKNTTGTLVDTTQGFVAGLQLIF
jgi:hypothetical protein